MRLVTDLDHLQHAAIHRLANIQARLLRYTTPPDKEQERDLALCLIDAQNTWSLFARYFFVSCALGARRASGTRTSTTIAGFRTPQDVVDFAIHQVTPIKTHKKKFGPRDEPPWHLNWVLPKLVKNAGFSNETQVIAAFSIQGRALEDLPKARNFFAHRSAYTAQALIGIAPRYGLPASTRAGVLPGYRHPKRPYSIAAGWVAELQAIVRLLAL